MTEKKVMKEKERPMEEVIEDTQRTPKEECTEKSCSCCKPCCCMSCPLCPLKCCPLRLFLFTLLFAVGFIFYLIIRDDPSVTFELCQSDAKKCVENIVAAVKPYKSPYALINYLRAKGYVH